MLPDRPVPFAFGRFAVDLPPHASLRGRQQAIAHLPVSAAPLAPGDDIAAIRRRILDDKRSLTPPRGAPSAIVSDRMLLADMVSVIHHDDPEYPGSIAMEAARIAGGTAFTIRGGNSIDRAAALEDAASRIGAAIVPTLAPDPPEPGFAIDRGVVAMPMYWQESAECLFDLPDGATLALQSHSNGDVLPRSLLEKQALVAPRLLSMGIPAAPRREGPRLLADLPGEELVLQSPTGVLLQWEYVGKPRSGEDPQVTIRLELGEGAELAPALPAWDAFLSSFRRRRST